MYLTTYLEKKEWPCPFCEKPFKMYTKLDFHTRRYHGVPVSQGR